MINFCFVHAQDVCLCAKGGVTRFTNSQGQAVLAQIVGYWPSDDNSTVIVEVEGTLKRMSTAVYVKYREAGHKEFTTGLIEGTGAFCIQSCKKQSTGFNYESLIRSFG